MTGNCVTEDETVQQEGELFIKPGLATLYRASISMGTQEVQTIWARYTAFLLINGFLVNAIVVNLKSLDEDILFWIGILGVIINIAWYFLNFSGWLNQNRWYNIAAQLLPPQLNARLPTRSFSTLNKPKGYIYRIAQVTPLLFIVGSLACVCETSPIKNNLIYSKLVSVGIVFSLIFISILVIEHLLYIWNKDTNNPH